MWYGLVADGVLQCVQWFSRVPLIWDFHCGSTGGAAKYDVVEVNPVIVGRVPDSV